MFRLPAESHIGLVRVQVSDLGRSVSFYERVLGLRQAPRPFDVAQGRQARPLHEASVVLCPQDDDRPLLSLHEKPGVAPMPPGTIGLFHFAVLLPDRPSLGRFLAHILENEIPFGAADHRVSESFYLTDPDGLGIEVYADRPRTTWQHVGKEFVITTETLDLDSVLADAGDVAWHGAPPGTVMGHVHLHVGQLDEAKRFYLALGLDITASGYPGALFYAAGGYHHHIANNTWGRLRAASDVQAKLIDWELIVPNASGTSEVANSLRTAGFAVEESARGRASAIDPSGIALNIAISNWSSG